MSDVTAWTGPPKRSTSYLLAGGVDPFEAVACGPPEGEEKLPRWSG